MAHADFYNENMIENFNNELNICTADELFTKYVKVYNKIMTKFPQGCTSASTSAAKTLSNRGILTKDSTTALLRSYYRK